MICLRFRLMPARLTSKKPTARSACQSRFKSLIVANKPFTIEPCDCILTKAATLNCSRRLLMRKPNF